MGLSCGFRVPCRFVVYIFNKSHLAREAAVADNLGGLVGVRSYDRFL
jgi:hypothetical protein